MEKVNTEKKAEETPEFDRFSEDYDQLLQKSITASGYEAAYFDEYKIKTVYDNLIRMIKLIFQA